MVWRLALADILHERKMALCYAVALAAVLAPLMVLYGLKFGVVTALTQELLHDPANRQVHLLGNRAYTPDWIAALAARPEVAFVVPTTRTNAATLYAERPDRRGGTETVSLLPSAAGDPLLDPARPPLDGHRVAITRSLAEWLELGPGDVMVGRAVRQRDGRQETVTLDLEIDQIVPPRHYQRRAIFAPVDLLLAVERYRDAMPVPAYGWDGPNTPPAQAVFASVRLYAADLDAVQVLADDLAAAGETVRSSAAEIATVQALDRNLAQIFAIIAGLGGVGYLLSLGANLWSNVERKQGELSVLRLLGMSSAALVRFPVCQAVAIAAVGSALAFAVYFAAETAINTLFAAPVVPGEAVCLLLARHYLVAGAMTLAAAVLASAVAGWQASRVEPAEGMRSV